MFRFILSFLGGIFTTLTMGLAMAALTVGAIFWMYGRDLPSHDGFYMERDAEGTNVHGRFDGREFQVQMHAEMVAYRGEGFGCGLTGALLADFFEQAAESLDEGDSGSPQ